MKRKGNHIRTRCCRWGLGLAMGAAALCPAMAQVAANYTEVPVLCYHQVRSYTQNDNAAARSITVTPEHFAAHMHMLADSGFHPILPDLLYDHYTKGIALPAKPVIISFDDNTRSQYTEALPILNRFGFKAVFFVMTVSIDRPFYMSKNELLTLHRQGHMLGGHTWDHHNMRTYGAADWPLQLDKPFEALQRITGAPVRYFAYPYGAWSGEALRQLEKRDVRLAFILHTPGDAQYPLLTRRRLMVMGSWSAATLYRKMQTTFPGSH